MTIGSEGFDAVAVQVESKRIVLVGITVAIDVPPILRPLFQNTDFRIVNNTNVQGFNSTIWSYYSNFFSFLYKGFP